MWVNANPVYSYGTIVAMSGAAGVVPHPSGVEPRALLVVERYQGRPPRVLVVHPRTVVVSAGGSEDVASIAALNIGDFVSYTATADVPSFDELRLWTTRITQWTPAARAWAAPR
jgi:hypothetical protein